MKKHIILAFIIFLFSSALMVDKDPPVTIYMIGDSTMANKPLDKQNQERGWGQMLPSFLTEDIIVENHAMNGRSSKSFIDEGRWDTVLARLKKSDYVIIQFGHNDEKTEEKLHTVPGSTFDENLRRFITETREKGAYPVLLNSIVRRNYPPPGTTKHQYTYETEGNILIDTHGEYAEVPRRIAKEMNVAFIDMTRLTHEFVSELGPEKSKQLFMWIPSDVYEFCPKGKVDNTHLNIDGAKMIARLFVSQLTNVIPTLAPYIRYEDTIKYTKHNQ